MHRMIRRTLTSVAALPLLLAAAPALAGAPTDQLKSSIDQVIKVLEDTSLKGGGQHREAARGHPPGRRQYLRLRGGGQTLPRQALAELE